MSLSSALVLIESGNVKSRREGFSHLQRLLRSQGSEFASIFPKEKHLLDFFTRLINVVGSDRKSYLSAKSSDARTTQTTAANKFTDSIRACRHAVELTVRYLRFKSFSILIDSLLSWLTNDNGDMCHLVARDCLKAIHEILAYKPHLEHISTDQWTRLCKKSCKNIEMLAGPDLVLNTAERGVLPEIARILRDLTSIPGSWINTNSVSLYQPLLKHLQLTRQVGDSEYHLLAALNSVLAEARSEICFSVRSDLYNLLAVVEKLWTMDSTRRNDLKDELVRTLLYLMPFMADSTQAGSSNKDVASHLHRLHEILYEHYCTLQSPERLHLDDLQLGTSMKLEPYRMASFLLTSKDVRAYRAWNLLLLSSGLVAFASTPNPDSSEIRDFSAPRQKKARTETCERPFIRLAQDPNPSKALSGIQTLALGSHRIDCTEETLQNIVEFLLLKIDDNDLNMASWAYCALSGFIIKESSSCSSLSQYWIDLWDKATRALKSTVTCRTASFTLHLLIEHSLIPQEKTTELLSTYKISLDVLGPAVLIDGSSYLMCTLLRFCRTNRPVSFETLGRAVVQWAFKSWDPGSSDAHSIRPARLEDVLHLVCDCLQLGPILMSGVLNYPNIFTAASEGIQESNVLISYLLGIEYSHDKVQTQSRRRLQNNIRVKSSSDMSITASLNLCISKQLKQCLEVWCELQERDGASIDARLVTETATLLKTCEVLLNCNQIGGISPAMTEAVLELLECMVSVITFSVQFDSPLLEETLGILTQSCHLEDESTPSAISQHAWDPRFRWPSLVSSLVEKFRGPQQSTNDVDETHQSGDYSLDDFDAMNGLIHVQRTQGNIAQRQSCASMYRDFALGRLATEVQNMNSTELVAGASFLLQLQAFPRSLDLENTTSILEALADVVLPDYALERSEATLCLILQFLCNSIDIWISPDHRNLNNLVLDLYEYFCTAFAEGKLTATAQIRFSDLVIKIWAKDPDFGQDGDAQAASVRTTLFNLVRAGTLVAKYHISRMVDEIFSFFTPANHDAVFDDLESRIDANVDHMEGLAVRISFFGNLGVRWQSLLRKVVFYIFEAAGKVSGTTCYATTEIERIQRAHNFRDSKAIFEHFSPQLIYTWMNGPDKAFELTRLPFGTFGYDSLEDILCENFAEIKAQCLLFGKIEEQNLLISKAGDIAVRQCNASFVRGFTYVIAHDVSVRQGDVPIENDYRKGFASKDDYISLVRGNLAQIVARLILSTELDGGVERYWEKTPEYGPASEALRRILELACDERPPMKNLQPSFKGKNLMHGIERISRRASIPVADMFSGAYFLAIARYISDATSPSLGSLHNRAVIQRLRLVCALSRQYHYDAYTSRMLLHTLRPFLLDNMCFRDTLGIICFAYEKSTMTTAETNGALLATLLTMAIAQGRPEQAQDSQFATTAQVAERVRAWLIEMLRQDDDGSVATSETKELMECAMRVKFPTNLDHGSCASILLERLLDATELSSASRKELVQQLIQASGGANASSDAFGTHTKASHRAQQVLELIDVTCLPDRSALWVARLAGNFYSATGTCVRTKTTSASQVSEEKEMDFAGAIKSSMNAITDSLLTLLRSASNHDASIAEHTLRAIVEAEATADKHLETVHLVPEDIAQTLRLPYSMRRSDHDSHPYSNDALPSNDPEAGAKQLAVHLLLWMITKLDQQHFLGALSTALQHVDGFAVTNFGPISHLALANQHQLGLTSDSGIRDHISNTLRSALQRPKSDVTKICLELVEYLLQQPFQDEVSRSDRLKWLDIEWDMVAEIASIHKRPTTALILLELARPTSVQRSSKNSSRRSSISSLASGTQKDHLLLSIFNTLDDPDSFYGVGRPLTITSFVEEIDHEDEPRESLRVHAAMLNTSCITGHADSEHPTSLVSAFSRLRMDYLTRNLSSTSQSRDVVAQSVRLTTARRLYDWDVPAPELGCDAPQALYKAYQGLATMADPACFVNDLNVIMLGIGRATLESANPQGLAALSVMSEMQVLLASDYSGPGQTFLKEADSYREHWDRGQRDALLELLSHRQSIAGVLRRNALDQAGARHLVVDLKDALDLEIRSALHTCRAAASMESSDYWFNEALALYQTEDLYAANGLKVSAAATKELACSMWSAFRNSHSVKLLQELARKRDLKKETYALPLSVINTIIVRTCCMNNVATFTDVSQGRQTAETRLEKPEDIIRKYLKPALDQLDKDVTPDDQAMVYHEFAQFCDQQLQNAELTDDIQRLKRLREKRRDELRRLEHMLREAPASDKQGRADIVRKHRKERSWYDLDDADYKRMRSAANGFAEQALRNYLRSLSSSDRYDSTIIRFFALWMEHHELPEATTAIGGDIEKVPSYKFVTLLNQMLSRLGDSKTQSLSLLDRLIGRMCKKHPYHCVFPLFSSCHASTSSHDTKATARKNAALQLSKSLREDKKHGELFRNVWTANSVYDTFAQAKFDRPGRANLKSVPGGRAVERLASEYRLPPPTITLELRPDGNYENVPTIDRFRSQISIASGISAPKILTAIASNGRQYKMLCKGGNDDLRQDAIMEQVFSSVSRTLKNHEATRKRKLGVRTYVVLPLTSNSGIIEFVPNSIPLHDYLIPAHEKYYPSDIKSTKAREMIKNVQENSRDQRIKAYEDVTKKYNPVLRNFFLERFQDPTEWYEKRIAYSRSTAAISILGHVLGLGDRHCHNILLDEQSGEAVHIDLGIAFETGRVLPVPETVPFRLTRDIVDGMGITGVEGVFRRCCEFTLEALRMEKAGIMTILDVLRYDPLYSWTITPLRAKRMQGDEDAGEDGKGADEQSGEAERALGVVEKKLGSGLNKQAAVNELIQTATDPKNLALLFAGWGAYN